MMLEVKTGFGWKMRMMPLSAKASSSKYNSCWNWTLVPHHRRQQFIHYQRSTKSDSQTVQYGFHLSYHPSENFLFDFIAVQEKTVNFGI